MISAIAAVDMNWGIGFNNQLLESIPNDLKRFKEITSGNTVIMGRLTWDSLPVKPLPNRRNIVISSNKIDGIETFSMEEAIDFLKTAKDDVYIIGGQTIYRYLLPFCDKIYLTKIYKEHENVDSYFPNIDNLSFSWNEIKYQPIENYKDLKYQFCEYCK